VAEHELAASGQEACINLETAASSAISSTSARLHDLQQRLLQYDKQERSQQVEMVSKDYAKGIKDLLYVIAQCEAITARLDAIGAGIDRDA
jgi:DNA-binding TFAR19-related protein (PDSD5 family)